MFSRSLTLPFLLSGSVHLGLIALLLIHASVEHPEVVAIDWIETTVPKMAPKTAPKMPLIESKTKKSSPRVEDAQPIADSEITESFADGVTGFGADMVLSAEERYKMQLARELNAKKFYPVVARKLKHQGRVIVQFNVSRDGQVLEAKVVQASPFQTLNQSAKELVENLRVLAPFPKEIQKSTWLFQVPVDYQM